MRHTRKSLLFFAMAMTVVLFVGLAIVQAAKSPPNSNAPVIADPDARIPIMLAMERMARPATPPVASFRTDRAMPGADLYGRKCAACHGDNGEGKPIRVLNVAPYVYERPISLVRSTSAWQQDRNKFYEIVAKGMPGYLMPGQGTLTRQQLDDLYSFMRAFAAK